jgi:hypothetical protein
MVGIVIFTIGATLIVCFGLLAFEGGIVADETGSTGSLSSVESAMGIMGLVMVVVGAGMWIISATSKSA